MADKEKRYIVRIANKDLDGAISIERAVRSIKGISQRTARIIALNFQKESGIALDTPLGEIPENMDKKLEDIVLNLNKIAPSWSLNRQRDPETGENSHLIMADLDFAKRKDIQKLGAMKSFRGLRLSWGLPVRGQRTKSSFRKGGVVGVTKKEARK
jgi:small subunit ribosomal protein S13